MYADSAIMCSCATAVVMVCGQRVALVVVASLFLGYSAALPPSCPSRLYNHCLFSFRRPLSFRRPVVRVTVRAAVRDVAIDLDENPGNNHNPDIIEWWCACQQTSLTR